MFFMTIPPFVRPVPAISRCADQAAHALWISGKIPAAPTATLHPFSGSTSRQRTLSTRKQTTVPDLARLARQAQRQSGRIRSAGEVWFCCPPKANDRLFFKL
jgi:hypothetical protein